MIFHDYFTLLGGGERLIHTLSRLFSRPIITAFAAAGFYGSMGWHVPVRPLLPQIPPGPASLHGPIAAVIFATRGRKHLPHGSRVVFSGNFAPLAVDPAKGTTDVFYCHTPPRFLFDLRAFYWKRMPAAVRPAYRVFLQIYAALYHRAVQHMHVIVANSRTVQGRIRRYLGRDAQIVHPPCDTRRFRFLGQDDYYLSMARLDPAKNVGAVVKAFTKIPRKKLVVVSGGSELAHIRRLAQDATNIHVLGWVPESTLTQLVGRCIGTIYVPKEEDFGMSPVESMAAGKPVIGVREGGVQETVVHGRTGLLLQPNWRLEHLVEAVEWMSPEEARRMRHLCEQRALNFSEAVFYQKMRHVLL